MPRPTNQLRELARLGAPVRLKELRAEMALIQGIVRDLGSAAEGSTPHNGDTPGERARPRKGRRKMSAAARARIAAAQRKRWAAVKKAAKM